MTLPTREPFTIDFSFDSRQMREQLSDVPDTWREATVTERTMETGIAECADGSRVGFAHSNLLRNRTYWENTQVGDRVWITERGGISAHPPDTVSARDRYDAMMREQAKLMAEEIDKRFAASPFYDLGYDKP